MDGLLSGGLVESSLGNSHHRAEQGSHTGRRNLAKIRGSGQSQVKLREAKLSGNVCAGTSSCINILDTFDFGATYVRFAKPAHVIPGNRPGKMKLVKLKG